MEVEFQTRSNSSRGKWSGCAFWKTFQEAYTAAQEDLNIYKISYTVNESDYRWVRETIHSLDEYPNVIEAIRKKYPGAAIGETFWWNDPMSRLVNITHASYSDPKSPYFGKKALDVLKTLAISPSDVMSDSDFGKLA
jgi:hypothetical protein